MSAEALLARLEKVRRIGAGKWSACCPAHPDKNPSLRIRELDDGRVLVRCFSHQCGFEDIVVAACVDMSEMFPPSPPRREGYRPERQPFLPSDVFEIARFEVAVASLIACDLNKGRTVSQQDYERLLVAWSRLEHIAETAYGR